MKQFASCGPVQIGRSTAAATLPASRRCSRALTAPTPHDGALAGVALDDWPGALLVNGAIDDAWQDRRVGPDRSGRFALHSCCLDARHSGK